jgi:hypothetical protein
LKLATYIINENLLGLQKSFHGYTVNDSLGLPLLLPITKQAVIVPTALIGTIFVSQYLLTSSVYFDEYDGEVYEKK